jgi:hypothetical protein
MAQKLDELERLTATITNLSPPFEIRTKMVP